MKRFGVGQFILAGVFAAAVAFGSATTPITAAGSIKDSLGSPVTGTHSMTFRIYDNQSGGALLWTEVHSTVSFTNGIYSEVMGTTTSLSGVFGENLTRWLSVSLDGGSEFAPRQQITATAYAIYSEETSNSAALGGVAASGYALTNHSHPGTGVVYGSSGGNVVSNTFLSINGTGTFTTEANVQVPAPLNMTVLNLTVSFTNAPGIGNSRTLTLRKNGIITPLSVTISGASTIGQDTLDEVSFSPFDMLSIQVTSSGVPTNAVASYSFITE